MKSGGTFLDKTEIKAHRNERHYSSVYETPGRPRASAELLA